MIEAIRALPSQNLPSQVIGPGLLDGLEHVTARVALMLAEKTGQAAE